MGMIMGITTLSDSNVERVVADPPLVWQLVAPDDPEPYELARSGAKPGFFARLLGRRPDLPPDLVLGDHEAADADLDKSWHGIHYLLTGTAWAGPAPANFLLEGGRTAGDLDVGYGPVRLHTSRDVKKIHEHLESVTDENLRARFNPIEMTKLDIYPTIWDRPPEEDDTLGYLMEYVSTLRDTIGAAAKHGMGIAIYLT